MKLRKVLGRAMYQPIAKALRLCEVTKTSFKERDVTVAILPKDRFGAVMGYATRDESHRTYSASMTVGAPFSVRSKWSVSELDRELAHSDGVLAILTTNFGTCSSFSGEIDKDVIRDQIRKAFAAYEASCRRDSQKSKLYNFEEKVLVPYIHQCSKNSLLTGSATRKLFRTMSEDYGIEQCELVLLDRCKNAGVIGHAIYVNPDVLDASIDFAEVRVVAAVSNKDLRLYPVETLLHELAHIIVSNEMGRRCKHNEQFTAVLVELVRRYVPGTDVKTMVKMFRENKIRVDSHSIFDEEGNAFFPKKSTRNRAPVRWVRR